MLDLGAGSAPYRECFAHCTYLTQDFASLRPDQLTAGHYGRIDYVCDASSIPVEDAFFDVVVCTEMLEHVPEPVSVIGEITRVLRPGGILILTAPLGSGIHQEPYHFYGGYTPYWYLHFLGKAGYQEIEIEANHGLPRFFSQESLRFLQTTRPFALRMPLFGQIAWIPLWLLLLPVLGVIIPLSGVMLDSFDRERRFTVGYHVRAIRPEKNLAAQ